jgi:hypothetical protein
MESRLQRLDSVARPNEPAQLHHDEPDKFSQSSNQQLAEIKRLKQSHKSEKVLKTGIRSAIFQQFRYEQLCNTLGTPKRRQCCVI